MEAQELRLAKYFTAGISFLLLALGGSLWPFTWWDMYSTGDGYSPPTEVSRLELHVVDSSGQQHVLRPMDLYTLDNDTSNQTPGHQLVQNAIEGNAEQQAIYRPYLIQQIEFALDTKIEQVEAWRYFWQVDFDQQPPMDIHQPAQTVLIDRFAAHPTD
ncbi:hypothetical protein SPB21_24370 [Leptothoe sp. ISB3NOV94-8A]|uniref:Uncharacterized protein n=1 Tax=Adonisia turfae CCMR0081 TaxID=2292702 RepID=A0A6M0RG76_9CYAN|nr:hypothetical protein [Adonisia turfae]MDV3349792.1 hypothetical protein [Leptothoe sp. LEGE 181152]NEZ54742.1 hypothetical protein [Adonisia turfae CCMR0081]